MPLRDYRIAVTEGFRNHFQRCTVGQQINAEGLAESVRVRVRDFRGSKDPLQLFGEILRNRSRFAVATPKRIVRIAIRNLEKAVSYLFRYDVVDASVSLASANAHAIACFSLDARGSESVPLQDCGVLDCETRVPHNGN